MTESLNGGGTGITGDENSLLFELMSLLLNNWLSRGVSCEELDNLKKNLAEVDRRMNYSIDEKQISPVMTTCFSLSDFPCNWSNGYHGE